VCVSLCSVYALCDSLDWFRCSTVIWILHMTAAVGWSFMFTWEHFDSTVCMYSMISCIVSLICAYAFIVSRCNQCLNGWLVEKWIDPLSAALSIILWSQSAQQSITETFEKRERGIRILMQVIHFYDDAPGFRPPFMVDMIMCKWRPMQWNFCFVSHLLFFLFLESLLESLMSMFIA